MRRGRPGLGGWRNENPKHFGPRGGGTPHYRPSRHYGLLDGSRFPPPGPRNLRPPYFNSRSNHGERGPSEYNNRNQYRSINQYNQGHLNNRGQYRDQSGPRYLHPYSQHMRHKDSDPSHSNNFYENVRDFQPSLGNISENEDQRHINNIQHNQKFQKHITWSNSITESKKHYEDQSPNKIYRHQENTEQRKGKPLLDFPGHRPPSSDYYGGNPSPVANNNTAFNRSLDDTVDIVRKKLLNRNESQALIEDNIIDQSHTIHPSDSRNTYQKNQNDLPIIKRRIQRQKQTVNSSCDKIKNKIVHQLFKMDKDKIHKLMDNPNSSTKFEYAINSLITESQISLNRHMRSAAEKSLCSSSTDFIQNDNNTIYEDTFMKQMQCILDPQDTVLLEDMKPLVMAELSKFLQIENYDVLNYQPKEEYADYQFDVYNSDDYSHKSYSEDQAAEILYDNIENYSNVDFNDTYQSPHKEDIKPLYERRPTTKSTDYSEERRQSSESRRKSSVDNRPIEEPYKTSPVSLPLFNSGTEQIIDEEDPFAELDQQYHVPVDHNFIQTDVYASPQQSTETSNKSNNLKNETFNNPSCSSQISGSHTINITNNFKLQMQNIPNSPLKVSLDDIHDTYEDAHENRIQSQCNTVSPEKTVTPIKSDHIKNIVLNNIDKKSEYTIKSNDIAKKHPEQNDNFNNPIKSCTQSNSRKRSIDQRPSHRKEKRKKSESDIPQSKAEFLFKNNNQEKSKDCKKESIYSYFSKNLEKRNITKEKKESVTSEKLYSDKYVKRKEILKRNETETSRKRNSNSICISVPSPKNNNNTSSSGLTPSKSDTKVTLKPIDMFIEQPKKIHKHQAHRNTALPPTLNKNAEASNKDQATYSNVSKKLTKRLVSKDTQTGGCRSCISKFSQTERKKFLVKAVQTDPVRFESFKSDSSGNSIDAFERMKEIDLEIQVLLQEKFKLYSSLENKDTCRNTMQTLGMTVVNVTPVEETKEIETLDSVTLTADAIADEFTNIPLEELEQIAVESMQDVPEKRPRRLTQKMLQYERSTSSPTTRRSVKKANPPNISLLEQIITDDRPLEDIIVLDEFETSPIKKKYLKKKRVLKKSKKPKQETNIQSFNFKECFVLLERMKMDKYIKVENDDKFDEKDFGPNLFDITNSPEAFSQYPKETSTEIKQDSTELIEENDIQFDMLDVSEDIVIGDDNCEVKSQDKELIERIDQPINEDIILDNSQSSCDDLNAADGSQEENECKTYDYATDENLRRDCVTVTGNADAVLAIECVENNFIAACLDGNVYHFNCDGQLINTLKGSNLAVTCLTIVKEKYGTTVYTGSLDSRIRYYDLETGLEKGPECNVLSPIQTMDRAWDTVFVGTRTGFVLQFECKNNILIPVSTVKFSDQSILALRAMKEGSRKVLLVAARSENVTIKDAQTGLLLRTLDGPNMTVYTLLFEDGKVYCGTSSHQIHVFEYTSGSHVGTHEGGKGAVCLRATGGLVFAGCYDGCVYVFRDGETRPLAQLRGPTNMLLSLAVVGSKIIAGYKDRSLYIWKIPLSILQEMIL